jgi:hypothetical protein
MRDAAQFVTVPTPKALAGTGIDPAQVLAVGARLGRRTPRGGTEQRPNEHAASGRAPGHRAPEEAREPIEGLVIHRAVLHLGVLVSDAGSGNL